MTLGCIYVARNDDRDPPNHYKIGLSYDAEPYERAKELTSETTNYIGRYEVKAWVQVHDVDECEKKLHQIFRNKRIHLQREFFNVELRDIVTTIQAELGDKIVPTIGFIPELDIQRVSKKILEKLIDNKSKNIFDLFNYAKNNQICLERGCWQCDFAFQTGLEIIILNILNVEIKKKDEPTYQYVRSLFSDGRQKILVYKELVNQLLELNHNHLSLMDAYINDERIDNEFEYIRNNGAIKRECLKYIFSYINQTEELKKIFLEESLNYYPITETFKNYNKKLIEEENERERIALEEEKKRIEQEEKNRAYKKKIKKENILKQKINQSKRNSKREEYLETLKHLPLPFRLKKIISEHPFGINGISEDLWEIEDANKFKTAYNSLDEHEKIKFKNLIINNQKSHIKKIKKIIEDL